MSSWDQSELAVTQSLKRIEESVNRIEGRLIAVEKDQSKQAGQTGILAVVISAIVSAGVAVISKLLWARG